MTAPTTAQFMYILGDAAIEEVDIYIGVLYSTCPFGAFTSNPYSLFLIAAIHRYNPCLTVRVIAILVRVFQPRRKIH